MKRTPAAAIVVSLAALALPAAAGASTIEVTASAGPSASEYIHYRVTTGERNKVQVLKKGRTLVLVDRGTKRIRPKGNAGYGNCRNTSAQRVVCPNFPLFAYLRDGDDRMTVAPGDRGTESRSTDPFAYAEDYGDTEGAVTETTWIDAGSGNDYIAGSRFNDVILPGTGADRAEGRDGPDYIILSPDGKRDFALGGGGIDTATFSSDEPLAINLESLTAGVNGQTPDTIISFDRVHGGSGNDVIRGSADTDALYGQGGSDEIHGEGGNDMVVGDAPIAANGNANALSGGDGDDVLDSRAEKPAPGTKALCGNGIDALLSGVDTGAAKDCEFAIPRIAFAGFTSPSDESVYPASGMRVVPVAKTADSVTFEVACPTTQERNNSGCGGNVVVERAPGGTAEQYGSGAISLAPGARGNVTVSLNAAGQAAVAGSDPVAVRLEMELAPPQGAQFGPAKAFAGWQDDL